MENSDDAILCESCCCAIRCSGKQFCLAEPLFTYTARKDCADYVSGDPITEEEFEDYNAKVFGKND